MYNLDKIIQSCRKTVDGWNANTLVGMLREQNAAFEHALSTLEKVLLTAERVEDADREEISLKTATVFILAMFSRMKRGGTVDELTDENWKAIADFALDYAVIREPKEFSLLVFRYYRDAIQFVIEPMRVNAAEDTVARLEEIVQCMDANAELAESGELPEARYIEGSLWLSLEAIFLVLSDQIGFSKGRQELANAAGALAFQSIRYRVYSEELAAVERCLEEQDVLDAALAEQVNEYIEHLNRELDDFDAMIAEAFSQDHRVAFRGSANLARAMGENQVLETTEDVDDFFLGESM